LAGKHCVQELYKADSSLLNDEAFVRESLVEAAHVANATLLDVRTHLFEPQGVTGFVLLAESHISIHTWPELGYAAIDVYTCGTSTKPEAACNYLYSVFNAGDQKVHTIVRPVPKFTCA
jgi:S-adenosylmethionine decarboxylase